MVYAHTMRGYKSNGITLAEGKATLDLYTTEQNELRGYQSHKARYPLDEKKDENTSIFSKTLQISERSERNERIFFKTA